MAERTLLLVVLGIALAAEQQAPTRPAQPSAAAPYAPRQSDRPTPVSGDEPGFQPIFNGKTLSGWEGDQKYWRVEDGMLVGEITAATIVKSNTFLIWRGGRPKDFELKLDYRITSAGNSGINYRSVSVPDPVTPDNKFALRGYQFDLDGGKRHVGNNYEEKGRLFVGVRGQVTRIVGGRPPVVLSTIGDPTELAGVATDDWNAVHLIIRGNTLVSSPPSSADVLATLSLAHLRAGNSSRADELLKEVLARKPLPTAALAGWYAATGDDAAAWDMLERTVANGPSSFQQLMGDPVFDRLRSDERFTQLLRRAKVI